MTKHEFIFEKVYMEVGALYRGGRFGWEYEINFETGIFNCHNGYGYRNYHLDENELIAFEREIIGSHALDWDPYEFEDGFDGRYWYLELTMKGGEIKELGGMASYKYDYFRLEYVFVFTEQKLRDGSLEGIDYLRAFYPNQWVDMEGSRKRYPDEFRVDHE